MSISVDSDQERGRNWKSLLWRSLLWCFSAFWWWTRMAARFSWWCMTPVRAACRPLTELRWWKQSALRLRMQSVPLRRWLVLSLCLLIFLPVLTGAITAKIVDLNRSDNSRNAETVLREGLLRWDDAAWRSAATAELSVRGVDFVLYEDGTEIYRSKEDPLVGRDYPGGVWQLEFGDGQMAILYGGVWGPFEDSEGDWPVPVVAISTLILTFIGMGIFFGRTVVRPLAATSSAAEDIAGGDLAVSLPGSRVREVAELNAAVEGMASALADSLAHEAKLEQDRRFLIGAVAHDLRTPLFALRGSLEAILTGVADTDDKKERYLQTAQVKADTLDRLISDLFDYTRLEFLEQAPNQEDVRLSEILQQSVESLQTRARDKSIALTASDSPDQTLISGDAHLLTRAFENLIDNAIRFTPEGGWVRVDSGLEHRMFTVSISDSGPGISSEDLTRIFDPLFRGEASRNRRTGGAGLGLTIARNVFEAHGGSLSAGNGPEGGAVFTATIPQR